MSTELNEIIEKAKRLAERERVVKEQPINCKYRNKLYYNNVFKQHSVDEAFEIVAQNIKKPTFKYELDIAMKTFEDFYGTKFMSKEQRKLSEAEIENERLRKLSIALYRKIESSPDVCNLDEFDEWEKALGGDE